jgi:hypothetical protein
MIAYARALGYARTGNIVGAAAEIGRLQSLEDKLKGDNTYWANQVEVQRLAAAGILAHVRGDDKKAVALMRAAADLDATMDKDPATPFSVCETLRSAPVSRTIQDCHLIRSTLRSWCTCDLTTATSSRQGRSFPLI